MLRLSSLGVHPKHAKKLLRAAKDMGLHISSLCFHVEGEDQQPKVFQEALMKAVDDSRSIRDLAEELGCKISCLNLGGGFPGGSSFEETGKLLRQALDQNWPNGTTFIAEPGRFFVTNAVILLCRINGFRSTFEAESEETKCTLFVSDSVFDNFAYIVDEKCLHKAPLVVSNGEFIELSYEPHDQAWLRYTIRGATSMVPDTLGKDILSPRHLSVGDWLCYTNLGAYLSWPSIKSSEVKKRHQRRYIYPK